MAFSSETPVDRWYGKEILDHSPGSVDLSRMENGGAILVDHDWRDHVGVVEKISIDPDRKGRLTARFGNSTRANEIFRDLAEGIRRNVSVGYRVMDAKLERTNDDGEDEYRVVSWSPYEVSVVAIPADVNTGVGRSIEDNEMEVDEDVTIEESGKEKLPVVSVEDIRKQEMARMRAIRTAGAKFKRQELADEYIDDGKSVDEFREALLDKITADAHVTKPVTQIGLTEKETQRYSFFKAIRAFSSKDWSNAEFELECSQEIAERLDREPRGFFVPFEVQERIPGGMDHRAPPMTKASTGNLIGTDHLGGSFIDRLRAETTIGRLGTVFMQGLVGDVDIPRLDAGATFNWIGDNIDAPESDATIGSVTLAPTTLSGAVPMSRRLLKQSDPSVEGVILNDLVRGAAIALDIAAFTGSGASDVPEGIVNTTGVSAVGLADWAGDKIPTFAEIVEFETTLATDEAAFGSLSYVTYPTIYGGLKTTPVDPSSSGIMVIDNGEANGFPITRTTSVGAGNTIFANWNDLLVGMWGVLDVRSDPYTYAARDSLVLRVFQDVDTAVRHPESFCIAAAADA